MTCIVDTHVLIWSLVEPERLRRTVRSALRDAADVKHVSVVSFWEISLKYALGKLHLKGASPEDLVGAAVESGFQMLGIDAETVAGSYRLPSVPKHKDPFDRLLVWQCIQTGYTLLSADSRLKGYVHHGLELQSG